jgi:hypothetical protein
MNTYNVTDIASYVARRRVTAASSLSYEAILDEMLTQVSGVMRQSSAVLADPKLNNAKKIDALTRRVSAIGAVLLEFSQTTR